MPHAMILHPTQKPSSIKPPCLMQLVLCQFRSLPSCNSFGFSRAKAGNRPRVPPGNLHSRLEAQTCPNPTAKRYVVASQVKTPFFMKPVQQDPRCYPRLSANPHFELARRQSTQRSHLPIRQVSNWASMEKVNLKGCTYLSDKCHKPKSGQ